MFRYYDRMFKAILYLIGFALFAGIMAPPTLLAVPINAIQAKSAVETFLTARFPAVDPSTALTVTATGASWLAIAENV